MLAETQVVQGGLVSQAGFTLSPEGLALIADRGGLKVYQPMPPDKLGWARFIGLDVHKHYGRLFGRKDTVSSMTP
jgi:hypothetical protein